MTESVSSPQESGDTNPDSRTDPIKSFLSTVTDALAECGADDETVSAVETQGSAVIEHVDGLRDETEQLSERVDQLESETERLSGLVDSTRREQAEIRSDVHEVRESQDDGEIEPAGGGSSPSESGGKTTEDGKDDHTETVPSPQTALEDTIRLREAVAKNALTVNEQRARSVARDLGDYCDYNHQYGTYSLTASTLKKILTAQSDGDGSVHAQTVKRVRQFLCRLGEDSVSVVEDTGGTRRITFAESLIDRIEAYQAHGGVTAETERVGVKP